MPATPASSPAHFRVTMNFPNKTITGAFSRLTGGNATAEARRYRPGGSADEEVAGGPRTRDDLTLGREWRRDRDLEIFLFLDRQVGRGRADVSVQPLDDDFNAYGKPFSYPDALLVGVSRPDVDSDAGTDVAELEVSFAVSGPIG